MTYPNTTTRVSWVPAGIGVLLWASATALLLEDAVHTGRYDVATMATPILTAATVAAACLAHLRLKSWRLIGGAGFMLLALLGSTVMAVGTLGRIAEAKDGKEATIQATNRTYGLKDAELTKAKGERDRECKVMGPRCKDWQARVDNLTSELAGIVVKNSDAKADAITRLATLLGGNGERTKEIVQAFDPVLVPMFLELGSVGFFAGAFGGRRQMIATHASDANVEQALPQVLPTMNQRELARLWGCHESTVSRRLRKLEANGQLHRVRDGKQMLALPAPART
jgi:hypothetical protein